MTLCVKICGLTRAEDVAQAVRHGADALGFILVNSSPRAVTLEQVDEMVRDVPRGIHKVAVLGTHDRDAIDRAARSGLFTHLQFHCGQPPSVCAGHGLPVLRAFPLTSPGDEAEVGRFMQALPETVPLLDAARGGSGKTCDWEAAARLARRWPILLAGGLQPGNVEAAITQVRPAGVDVSSGVESAPGVKDPALVRQFIRNARAAPRSVPSKDGAPGEPAH